MGASVIAAALTCGESGHDGGSDKGSDSSAHVQSPRCRGGRDAFRAPVHSSLHGDHWKLSALMVQPACPGVRTFVRVDAAFFSGSAASFFGSALRGASADASSVLRSTSELRSQIPRDKRFDTV